MSDFDYSTLMKLREALGGPLLIHLVGNGVIGDSRVLRSAQVTASLGLPALIVGVAPDETHLFELDGIPVLRVKPGATFGVLSRVRRIDVSRNDDWFEARRGGSLLERRARRGEKLASALLASRKRRVLSRGTSTDWSFPAVKPKAAGRYWLRLPQLVDQERAISVVLDALQPAAIHIHDAAPLPAGSHAASFARLSGREIRVLYDAHEWLPGLVETNAKRFGPYARIESDYIHDADEVLTVSTQMAGMIQAHHGLAKPVGVVTNSPPSRTPSQTPGPSLRATIGLDDDVPLLVYSGWIDPERGVNLAVSALTELPGVHLAVVASRTSAGLKEALRAARAAGVQGRVHVAPYVAPHEVPAYLSTADVGLIPRDDVPNHNVSLPTKFREYLHAGLPLVTSDNVVMKSEIAEHRVGETFRAGDRAGLIAATRLVLADLPSYRSRITPEYLYELSWESQVPTLAAAHRRLVAGQPTRPAQPADLTRLYDIELEKSTEIAAAPTGSLRLGIGPANYAGQAARWTASVNRDFTIVATSFAPAGKFEFDVDHQLKRIASNDFKAMTEQTAWVLQSFTHLIIDGFRPVLGGLVGDRLEDEITLLRNHRMEIGLLAHGSEIRDPDRHMARLPQSYFSHVPTAWTSTIRAMTHRNAATAANFDGPLFVSTPDLLFDLPTAKWVPLAIDVAKWEGAPFCLQTNRPRVLHAPSRSNPPIKGTDVIEPILIALHDQGKIQYVRAENVPHQAMKDLVHSVDIVVDQVLTGSYGVAAIEAMAAGRLVLGFVSEDVRALLPAELPIVDVTDGAMAAVMDDILANMSAYSKLAATGPSYVRELHDGRRAAEVLATFVGGPAALTALRRSEEPTED